MSGRFTKRTKLEALRREITQRGRVYPRLVASGKMRQSEADYEIQIMEAIADDYHRALLGLEGQGEFGL